VRETVRDTVKAGLEEGLAPKTIAKEMREVIGLAPNQAKAVRNFEKMLREKDPEVLSRALRDKRFDGTITKMFAEGASLSEKQITTMVDKYRERFKAFHSETISRTTVLESNKLGQQASWESAIEEGVVDEANLLKQWVGVKDDREREEHLAMEGRDRSV
jgi:RecA-family ATPase